MRTRTPPLLKWLLVERATLAGDLAGSYEREATVNREMKRVQKRLALLMQEAKRLQQHQMQLPGILADKRVRLAALDVAIRLASEDKVSPTTAGTVRAFSGRYGKRGDLKAYIIKVLQQAAPSTVETSIIVKGAIAHFKLDLPTRAERQAFMRNSVTPQLFRLTEHSLVEALHKESHKGLEGSWRWKASHPAFDDLVMKVSGEGASAVRGGGDVR